MITNKYVFDKLNKQWQAKPFVLKRFSNNNNNITIIITIIIINNDHNKKIKTNRWIDVMKLRSAPVSRIYGKSVLKWCCRRWNCILGMMEFPLCLQIGPRGVSILRWAEERVCLKGLITRFPSQQNVN